MFVSMVYTTLHVAHGLLKYEISLKAGCVLNKLAIYLAHIRGCFTLSNILMVLRKKEEGGGWWWLMKKTGLSETLGDTVHWVEQNQVAGSI